MYWYKALYQTGPEQRREFATRTLGPETPARTLTMKCPQCQNDHSRVVDSRDSGDSVRRRRQCSECSERFTTYERVHTRALRVAKLDGRREEYDREKLVASLHKACAKRPLAMASIERLADEIEAELANAGRLEVRSSIIGELVMDKLKELDRVAYIRFASVYRDFSDVESFIDAANALLEGQDATVDDSGQMSFLDNRKLPRHRGRRRLKSGAQ